MHNTTQRSVSTKGKGQQSFGERLTRTNRRFCEQKIFVGGRRCDERILMSVLDRQFSELNLHMNFYEAVALAYRNAYVTFEKEDSLY